MSEVAGRLPPQMGAHALEKAHGGRGMLLGGVAGVPPRQGRRARRRHRRLQRGADRRRHAGATSGSSTRSVDRMRDARRRCFGGRGERCDVERAAASRRPCSRPTSSIGAVLVPGARAPKLVTREMLALMKPGAVLVDVAIDQGGCFETSQPDDARRPDLRGRRHRPLLRREHARRRADARRRRRSRTRRCPTSRRSPSRGLAGGGARVTARCARGVNVIGGQGHLEPVARDLGHPYIPLSEIVDGAPGLSSDASGGRRESAHNAEAMRLILALLAGARSRRRRQPGGGRSPARRPAALVIRSSRSMPVASIASATRRRSV